MASAILAVITLWNLLTGATFGAQSGVPDVSAHVAVGLQPPLLSLVPLDAATSPAEQYHLRMHHLHTGESLDVTYRVGNSYVPSALAMLNHFLRDHRTGDETSYDPHEFDLLHALMQKLHKPNGLIEIICGYRTPWSNDYLREHGRGVAEDSQHMLVRRSTSMCPVSPPGNSTWQQFHLGLAASDTIRILISYMSMSVLFVSGH